jgi:UDPglucose 6-dehydrogenase
MTLASQVDNTNRLASAAKKCGADWESIVTILKHDKRIGPHSYLTPGDWRASKHLMRDYYTLEEIEDGR